MDHYAVIGQPVAHSLSPRIHALFAARAGHAISYEAIEVAPEALSQQLERLHADGYAGLNVTLPHKSRVAACCESVSALAAEAEAVNTLIRTPTGWHGDNSDGLGLMRDLSRLDIGVDGRRVLLVGAGGAARGVLGPLLQAHPAELTLSNRNPWKPEALAQRFAASGRIRPCAHFALKGDRYDLVINATSAGHAGTFPRLPPDLLAPGADCYDLSYGRAHEPFRRWAMSQGASRVVDGLGMLVAQAAVSYSWWRGSMPDTAAVLAEIGSQLA